MGIYGIYCAANNKYYIGQSGNKRGISVRISKHRRSLETKKHENKLLQNAFNKYGIESFRVIVLEYCELNDLIPKEQFWIKELRSMEYLDGFNINFPLEGSVIISDKQLKNLRKRNKVSPMKGKHHSDQTKERMRRAALGRKISQKQRKLLSQKLKGRKLSLETRKKMSESKQGQFAKEHFFLNPKNETIRIFNLRQFCKENNMNYICMLRLGTKGYNSYRGWRKILAA